MKRVYTVNPGTLLQQGDLSSWMSRNFWLGRHPGGCWVQASWQLFGTGGIPTEVMARGGVVVLEKP